MRSGTTAILLAGLAGQLSASAVGALPLGLFPVTAVLLLGAAWLSGHADEARSVILRRTGTVGSLGVALAGLPALASGGADAAHLKGSLALMLLGVQVAQALGWREPRDLRTGLSCAVGLLLLGASYAPDVLVGIPILLGWIAALVALGQLKGLRPRQLVAPTAVAVVFGLVAFLLIPVPATAGLRSRLAGGERSSTEPPVTRTAQGSTVYSNGYLDLSLRGALATTPVLRVDGSSPTLWQGSTFDTYTGRSWTSPPQEKLAASGPRFQVAEPTGQLRTDQVTRIGQADDTIWAPGRIVSFDAGAVRLAQGNGLGDLRALSTGSTGYSVTSELPVADPALLNRLTGTDNTDIRWRLLPESLPPRVGALAQQITAGVPGRWGKVQAIEQWLHANATYRLDSPVPEPDQDAVDQFLFVDKTGFCEQFASAEAVLLRTLGIPTRLVSGLAYGTPDGAKRVYKASDLHAWVQLWVPGTGWVTSDPTAGSVLADVSSHVGLRTRVTTALSKGLRSLAALPGGRPALAVALLLLTALVAAATRRRRPRTADPLTVRPSGEALAAFLRFDARQGLRARRPAESLSELRERSPAEVSRALEVVEQECYAPAAPDPREAVEVLDRY
jgi:transglutaminase-like putative cysteine protease